MDYGVFFAVFNFSFLFHILLDVGINQFNNRKIAQGPHLLSEMFGKLMALKLGFSVLYLGVTFIIAFLIGFDELRMEFLLFLVFNQILMSLILFARSNFTAIEWYKWDTFFSVFDRILSIIICGVLLYLPSFNGTFEIMWFIYAQTFALSLAAIFSLTILVSEHKILIPKFDKVELYSLFKEAMPFALVILMMTIYTRIDAVMIERLLPVKGAVESGIYAAGYRLLDAVNMIPYLMASILIPVFAKMIKAKEEYKVLISEMLNLLLVLCIGSMVILYFYGNDILFGMYLQATMDWVPAFGILLITFNAICFNYLFGGFLTANNQLGTIGKLAAVAILFNILLNYLWIPTKGAEGAALATLITQSFMALAQTIIVYRQEKLSWNYKTFLKLIVYGIALVLSAKYLLPFVDLLLIKIVSITLIAITLAFLLQLLKWNTISRLKPNEN